jgi:Calx-beta domain
MSVNYATAAGTAGSSDFQARSGTLTFAAGETSKTVTVPTTQDLLVESTESFTINLSGATGGATIADGQGVGFIYDDDEIPDPGCGQAICP